MIIKRGSYANADLILFGNRIKKTFIRKPWWIKYTVGKAFIMREYRLYNAMKHIPHLNMNCRRSHHSITIDYIHGMTLEAYANKGLKLPQQALINFENDIKLIHKLGYAHLDLRNAKNVIIDTNGRLHIIDFQSGTRIRWWYPRFLRNFMQAMDLTAVSKFWPRVCDAPMSAERIAYFEKYNRYRKIWIFKGYPLQKLLRKRGKR